jgi:hypothetical protein
MMSELVGLGDHVSFRVDGTLAVFIMLAHCKGRERASVTKVIRQKRPRQTTVYKR